MSQITQRVKEVYEGKTTRGKDIGKPWWSITLENAESKLSTFKHEFVEGVVAGREYTFTYEVSGDYLNLTAPSVPVVDVNAETTPPEATTAPLTHEPVEMPPTPRGLGTASTKDTAIRKAVALKAAIEFANGVLGSTATTQKVGEYMREFEELLK